MFVFILSQNLVCQCISSQFSAILQLKLY